MDNISDGFGNERRFEFLFNSRVIGFVKLSDLLGGPDDKGLPCCDLRQGESPFGKQDNGGHLCQDIGFWSCRDFWFVKDFKVFLQGTVGSL